MGSQLTRQKKEKSEYQDHVVVFSMKMVGHNFLLDLVANKYKVVLVEDNEVIPHFEELTQHGISVFYTKDAGTELFDTLNIARATACVIGGGVDATNIELSQKIVKYLQAKGGKRIVKTLTHIENKEKLEVIKDYINLDNENEKFKVTVFNTYCEAAKIIYDKLGPHNYFDLNDDTEEHAIAVIGYNDTAEDFIVENLIQSHYKDCKNIKIYLVDKDADVHLFHFMYKYPYSREFIDVVPVKLLNNKFFANFNWSKELIEKLTKVKAVYMFGNNSSELINMATRFRQFLSGQTINYLKTPVIICHPEDTNILGLIDTQRKNDTIGDLFRDQMNVSFVHTKKDTCTTSRLIDEGERTDLMARIINYYYSIKYLFAGVLKEKYKNTKTDALINSIETKLHNMTTKDSVHTEKEVEELVLQSLAAFTKKSVTELRPIFGIRKWWDPLNDIKKSANRYAARHLTVKVEIMKSVNALPLNPKNIHKAFPVIAPIEHKRWSAEKMALNYRYGILPEEDKRPKNFAKDMLKLHDQLIPYDKLDQENKEKDLNIFLLMPLLHSLKVENKSRNAI